MKVTIDLREDWIKDVAEAMSDQGSNDDEHDLLLEVSDQVSAITGFDFIAHQEAYEASNGERERVTGQPAVTATTIPGGERA